MHLNGKSIMNARPWHADFRRRLLAGDELTGTFFKTPSTMLAEVIGTTGLDVICLDAEHSPFDRSALDGCLLALRAAAMPALVRVPNASNEQILNALDCGAVGVVVPHVCSAAEAQAIASATRYGAGGRGYAGSTRAAGYGTRSLATNLQDGNAQSTVIAQIEDLPALEEIDAIAAVEGIDALFIGMMDLTVALGETQPDAPAVVAACDSILDAARRYGRRVGLFTPRLDDLPGWRRKGASLFLLGSDHAFMRQGVDAMLGKVRA
jgi:2-keto-3-deoxy-L-rhamnonate aldolase RhmA